MFKRSIKFKTKDGSIAFLEVEVTERNKYPELTICGEHNGGHGQSRDRQPNSDLQQELLNIWETKQLKKIAPAAEKKLIKLLDEIEAEETERIGAEDVSDADEAEILALIRKEYSEEDAEKILALALEEDITVTELSDISGGGTSFSFGGRDWIVATDSEADALQDEDLDNYLEEYVLPDLPETAQRYFDNKAWKRDARMDGRGHSLGRYDGNECYHTVNGTTYYLYRQ